MNRIAQTTLNFLDAKPVTWLALTIPSLPMIIEVWKNERYYNELMWESGLLASQLLIIALAITPLMMLLRKVKPALKILRWFLKRRRAIGLAAFGNALLHTFFYVRHTGSLEDIILDLANIDYATGWIAFIAMLALAVTSNDASVRRMGLGWKRLQRWVYFVAAFTLLHWYLIDQFVNDMYLWFVPIILLQLLRVISPLVPVFKSSRAKS